MTSLDLPALSTGLRSFFPDSAANRTSRRRLRWVSTGPRANDGPGRRPQHPGSMQGVTSVNSPLILHKWACLPKLQVMGIGRTAAADKKRLRAHEVPMRFIALLYRLLRARPRFHRTFEPSELTI